jgi:hypothetical protein
VGLGYVDVDFHVGQDGLSLWTKSICIRRFAVAECGG